MAIAFMLVKAAVIVIAIAGLVIGAEEMWRVLKDDDD